MPAATARLRSRVGAAMCELQLLRQQWDLFLYAMLNYHERKQLQVQFFQKKDFVVLLS